MKRVADHRGGGGGDLQNDPGNVPAAKRRKPFGFDNLAEKLSDCLTLLDQQNVGNEQLLLAISTGRLKPTSVTSVTFSIILETLQSLNATVQQYFSHTS